MASPTFLMCPPDFFDVHYVINPWMRGREGTVSSHNAQTQWNALHTLLSHELLAPITLVPPQAGLPDIVFTANAGLVHHGLCVPARFRCAERQGEETHYTHWFAEHGCQIAPLPPGITFEGAGDALLDLSSRSAPGKALLWAASGLRSDLRAHEFLADTFSAEVVSLHLTDPRFYHLDTCFCPLPGGYLLWYPPALDAASRAEVETRVPAARRLAVPEEAALAFACNAVSVEQTVVMHVLPDQSRALVAHWLEERGFALRTTPLDEFLKAGGSAKCLTLDLAQ